MLQCAAMETSVQDVLEWVSHSEAQTIAFGQHLGMHLEAGDVLLLLGSFGMGKTHLTKGIAAGLGADPNDVNSPSFVLINEYAADATHKRMPIYHVDLYRIETPQALYSVGLEQCLDGDGVCIIEWAERATDLAATRPDHRRVHGTRSEHAPVSTFPRKAHALRAVVARLRQELARLDTAHEVPATTSITNNMLLAIDTSNEWSWRCLLGFQRPTRRSHLDSGRQHTEQIPAQIDLLGSPYRHRQSDLDVIAIATGPGSWAGCGQALSLAKAIAIGRNLPLIGIPSLDALAQSQHGRVGVVVAS